MRRVTGFSVSYIVKVTIAAAIGFLILKFIGKKVNVPGFSNAVNAL